jgi:hypothetical protein
MILALLICAATCDAIHIPFPTYDKCRAAVLAVPPLLRSEGVGVRAECFPRNRQ